MIVTRETCTHGPKTRYPDHATADAVLLDCRIRAVLHRSQRRRETRSYHCRNCHGWHLTSATS